MRSFIIYLVGEHQPLQIDLPVSNVDELADAASRAKFLAGCMTDPDEDGLCPRVMIATNRIQLVLEGD